MVPSSDRDIEHVPWRAVLAREHATALAIVCLGVWLHAADSLLVSTMMPAIVADIGGIALVPWTVALYEIGSIVAGAAGGLLAQRHGVRPPMVAAAGLFAAGCGISALAPVMEVLLAGRLLQGLGGGGLMAMAFVAVGLLFPPRLMARAVGVLSTVWAASAFLGPLIGGLAVELASWRSGFWLCALQAVGLALWLTARGETGLRPAAGSAARPFPLVRLLWLALGVVAVAAAGIAISATRTPAFVLAGALCLLVFLRLERGSAAGRLLPTEPIGLRNPVGAALTMILCFAAATVAIGVYVPLLVTRLHGISALAAGYVIAIEAIAWAGVATLVSGAPARRDAGMITAGMLIVTTSIAGFAWDVPQGPCG